MIGESEKRARRASLLVLASFAVLVVAPSAAYAQCGGLCLYEIGSTDTGSSAAGAGARAQDASTVLWNPAGMTRLEDTHILIGTDFGFFDMEFDLEGSTPLGAGTGDGGSLNSLAPLAGAFVATTVYDELRFGFSLNALYAGSVDYDNDWAGRTLVTDVALVAFNMQPALAYPITDWLSIGAGVNILYVGMNQEFRTSLAPDAPTVEIQGADDWAFGANVGALLEPREGTRIGIYYRTKAEARLEGDIDIPLPLSPNIDLELTFPQGVNVSLYHQLTPALALLGDAGWSDWSEFGQIPVSVGPLAAAQEREWKDTWRVAAGLRYRAGERWLVQGGFSYDSSPVGASKRLPDMPASEAYRFSVGAEFAAADNIVLAPSYTIAWFGDAEVDSVTLPPTRGLLGNPTTVVLDGDYDPYFAHFVGFKVVIRFGGES